MAAEKKPKAVVLGRGTLALYDCVAAVHSSFGHAKPLWGRRVIGNRRHGTLLWLPDPPKPKTKRGKR